MRRSIILCGAASFALMAEPAFGQPFPSHSGTSSPADQVNSVSDVTDHSPHQILVTGSRLTVPELDGAESLVRLDAQRVIERDASHFADTLNEIPGFRGSLTPQGAQASHGQGVNFISAYGLGSNRTLALVDGKRIVPSNGPSLFNTAAPGTQADLNAIPTILVKQVDFVSIGGAPVYGSDAIAGTVNVHLSKRLTRISARALSGSSSRGDNFRWKAEIAGGIDFADGRANITAALSHDRSAGVTARDRGYYRASLASAPNPCTFFQPGICSPFNTVALLGPLGRQPSSDGRVNPSIGFNDSLTDGNPGSVLIRDFGLAAVAPGGVVSSGPGAYNWQFAQDGTLVPYKQGTLFGAPLFGPFAPAALSSGGDGLKLFDYVSLAPSLKRTNAALFATFYISSKLTAFAEALYYRGTASETVDLPSFNAVLFQGNSGALTFRTDNPFLGPQAREQLASLGYTDSFQFSRANTDLADLSGSSRNKLYRIVAGLRGQLAIGERDYDFEISANYGRSEFAERGQTIDQQHFINAVNVELVGGEIACTTTPTVSGFAAGAAPVADPACVPLNLFGNGAASPEALDYILQDTRSKSELEQFVFNANIGGSPFDLFGNAVSVNAGVEHREEKASFTPDAFLLTGQGRTLASPPVSGSYNLDEIFGEILVPFITPGNGTPIHKLVGFARARRVESSTNGGFTAWTAGGLIAPVQDLEIRGNFTRSFRSPAILELFSPRSNVTTIVPDLCSPANIGAGPVPEVRAANCGAFLSAFPNATPLIAATATVPGVTGGNPNLKNERADSYTFGAVLRPRFVPGLSISVDYLDIDISNPISNLTIGQIAQGCFDNPQFDRSDPANANPFCSLIARDASGQVVADPQNPAVVTGYVNGKRIRMSGVQAMLNYGTGLSKVGIKGTLQVGADVFYLRRRLIDITGVAPARSDGLVGDPKWQGQLRLRYANEAWGVRTHVNYTGKQLIARDNRAPAPNDTREFDHFKAFATVDLSIFVNAGEDTKLTFSVTNLFDRVGQKYYGYIVPLSINDALGRRFALSFGKEW